jgi:hypothetical protein
MGILTQIFLALVDTVAVLVVLALVAGIMRWGFGGRR